MESMRERVLVTNFQPVGRIEFDFNRDCLDRRPRIAGRRRPAIGSSRL